MNNNPSQGVERRANFRLIFPKENRPCIIIRGIQFFIIDICEVGVRFYNPETIKLPVDTFQATVILHDNDPFNIVGRIIRHHEINAVMMMTIRGVPYQKIISEQDYLRKLNHQTGSPLQL